MEHDAWSATSPRRARQGWQRASRHSRLVRWLRIALPVIALVIVAGMLVSLRGLPERIGSLSLGEIGVSDSSLTMEQPSLTGYGSGGAAYDVTANRALQSLDDPGIVQLELISGRVQRSDGGWATLRADDGVYFSREDRLELENDIRIELHDGKRAFLEKANVDLEAETVVSDRPVRLEMPGARVRADRMEVFSGGDDVRLKGNVVVDLWFSGGPAEEASDGS